MIECYLMLLIDCSALRTPITRAKKGGLSQVHGEKMLSTVLKGILDKTGIEGKLIEDVVVGNVLPPGGGATVARMACLFAGIPESSSVMTVNRQCSSGLQAVAQVASAISAGYCEIGIGAGVESMSMHYGPGAMPGSVDEEISAMPSAADCMIPMGITSENVAEAYGIGRKEQDVLAVRSHQKAFEAQKAGSFVSEIVPVGSVQEDDGIRPETSLATLAKLRTVFKENGTTTAGNSSQVSDGAAAVLLMRRSKAQQLGLPVLAKFVAYAVAGVPPRVMGIGPAVAIPAVLARANLRIEDIDIVELNEAFASQAAHCIKHLKIPLEKVNPNGGAIALGHPLGATGARQIATLIPEMKRKSSKFGIVSMCIGTGMGAAAIIENE